MRKLFLSFLTVCCALAINAEAQQQAVDYYNSLAYQCYRSGDKAGAAKNFLLYLEEPAKRGMTKAQQDSIYLADRNVYDTAASNAMFIFFSLNDMDNILKVLPYGRRIQKGISNVYIAGMEAAKAKGNDALWLELLKEGAKRCKQNQQFINTLMDYYQNLPDKKQAFTDVDNMMKDDPQNPDLWYMKGLLYDSTEGGFKDARDCFSKALSFDSTNPYVNTAMGNTYLKEVATVKEKYPLAFVDFGANVNPAQYKKQLEAVQPFFFNAMQYLEGARHYDSENVALWGKELLQCYRMLNIKDKYDELYKLVNE